MPSPWRFDGEGSVDVFCLVGFGVVDGWMDGWMGGWMGGWMDGWMDGWVDGWINLCIYVCIYGRNLVYSTHTQLSSRIPFFFLSLGRFGLRC